MTEFDNLEGSVYKVFTDLFSVIAVILILAIATVKAKNIEAQAEYLATIEWDSHVDADVDIFTKVNTDKAFQPSDMIWYKNKSSSGIYLDRDSRGFASDQIKVKGEEVFLPHKEVVTIRGIVPRDLTFAVHLFRHSGVYGISAPSKRSELGLSVHFELVKINPEIKVVHKADIKLDSVGEGTNVVHVSLNGIEAKILELPINSVTEDIYVGNSSIYRSEQPTRPGYGGVTPTP